MKMVGIELTYASEGRQVGDRHHSSSGLDQFLGAELLDGAVDVNGRKPQRVCNLLLGQRHFETAVVVPISQSCIQLTKQVREPLLGRLPTRA